MDYPRTGSPSSPADHDKTIGTCIVPLQPVHNLGLAGTYHDFESEKVIHNFHKQKRKLGLLICISGAQPLRINLAKSRQVSPQDLEPPD